MPQARIGRTPRACLCRPRPPRWHYLTGGADAVRAIEQAVGFRARFDPALRQFLHPAGLVILTSRGVVSSYLLGVGYRPGDLRAAVTRAGEGGVAKAALPVLLLCFHFDPTTGRYTLAVTRLLQLAGVSHGAHDRRHHRACIAAREAAGWVQLARGLGERSADRLADRRPHRGLVRRAGAGVRAAAALRRALPPRQPRGARRTRRRRPLRFEIGWTAATLLVFLGLFVWGTDCMCGMYHPPTDALKIYVVAKQWMWKIGISGRPARDQRAARSGRPPVSW